VDLAGSENIKEHIDPHTAMDYGSVGYDCCKNRSAKKERAMEGKFINKSLFFLDQVLKKLLMCQEKKMNSSQLDSCHIPFRSTNLTKILKSCLSGNSKTKLIVCISPGYESRDQSISSMSFAIKAKKINQRSKSLSIQFSNSETVNQKYRDENKK